MATEAPPSYDSVIKKVNNSVKADPSFGGLQKTINNLSEVERTVLASHAQSDKLVLNTEQEKKFRQGFAEGFAQAQPHLEWNAEECATMCKKVSEDFLVVAKKLSAISSQDGSQKSKDLVADFVALQQRYQGLLTSSRLSAVKIAQNADRFDSVIVPIASDDSISIDTKKAKIREFIQEAKDLEDEANGLKVSFDRFLVDMTTYTGRFEGWAHEKEGELHKDIKQLTDDIAALRDQLAKISMAMIGLAGVAGVALPAFAVGAFCAGPFAPLVIALGIFYALGTIASITGLALKSNSLNDQIKSKKSQKKELEKELEAIQKSRQELKDLGKTLSDDVARVVGIINSGWQNCQDDAVAIEKWLEGGQKDTDVPPYMALDLGKADGVYSVVGKYLQKYADCLADISN